jgi:dihydropyrimidinase
MEGEAAGRVIDIAELVGTNLHIFHVTSPQAIERIAAARRRGQQVTAETCPQYLLLSLEVFDRPGVAGALSVCSPPIRDKATQELLWEALHEGKIQVISTDHCPFSSEEKATGINDYSRIPGGVPSIEMRFPALYHFGVQTRRISKNQWVDMCSTTPARLVGLKNKGDIIVGYDADLVIFDPNHEIVLSPESLHENVDWTPYDGFKMSGWPSTTISRGEVIVEGEDFLGLPGRGRYAKRQLPA